VNYFEAKRKSFTDIGKIYFWTASIHNWNHLLSLDVRKKIISSSIEYLSKKELVDIFGFVIMPNHVHFIWRMNKLNGKESPFKSFLKFTAHEFKKHIVQPELNNYLVNASNKKYEFWQRDSLAIELYTPEVAYQKLDYIHHNPLAKDWKLCTEPGDYPFSSANFYESGDPSYHFLKHIGEEF